MTEAPSIKFFVNRYTNLFYHVCVLFYEYFPDEYSLGILNNSAYRKQHEHLKTGNLHEKFRRLWRHSYYAWDSFGKSLFGAKTQAAAAEILGKESQEQAEIWLEILSKASAKYESIWVQTEAKLNQYRLSFEAEWNPAYKSILTGMSKLAKLPWLPEAVNIHLVDCVFGAESWTDDIVAPPFPIIDIEKKLLAHEMAHILIPDYSLKPKLRSLGLDCRISHTIVDLIAYFGVREHVTDSERKGIKPNPSYYADVPKLYPIFEDCYMNPNGYKSFDEILARIDLPRSGLDRE